MLPIPQTHLKVIHGRGRPRRVKFARTVVAADSWQVLVFQLVAGWVVGVGDGEHRFGVDGCVAHDAFEGVIGVGSFQLC